MHRTVEFIDEEYNQLYNELSRKQLIAREKAEHMLHSNDLKELKSLYQEYLDQEKNGGHIKYSLGPSFKLKNEPKADPIQEPSIHYSMRPVMQKKLHDLIEESDKKEPFKVQLVKYIDKKGYRRDSHFYLKCGITRQHFSKIVGWRKMIPQKKTVIVMALVLNLTIEEAEEFLSSANYHLSGYNKTDIVVRYCFEHGIYELEDVNEALEIFEEGPLI